MTRGRARLLGAGVVAAVLLLGAAATCGRRGPETAQPGDNPGATVPTKSPPGSSGKAKPEAEPAALAGAPVTEPKSAPGSGGTFARVSGDYRQHDLRLLSEVRRHNGGATPVFVERLLEARDAGTSEEALADRSPPTPARRSPLTSSSRSSAGPSCERWIENGFLAATEPASAMGCRFSD